MDEVFARPIAHRGLHGCGQPGTAIENTVAAANAAIAAGYGIECDVQLARDGTAMVFHDTGLERLTGSAGQLSDYEAGAAPYLHDGSAIPTLTAFLAAIAGRAPLVIEIKVDGGVALAEAVLAAVAGYRGPLALESFDPAIVARCAAAACPIGLVGPDATRANAMPRCDFLSWNIAYLPEAAARRPALPLTSWTIRTASQRAQAAVWGAQIVFEGFRP